MATTLRKCRFVAASDGVDDFQVALPVAGYFTPSQAHAEDLTYNYIAFFGPEFESGDGAFSTATGTLTRDIILSSSNNDLLVSFSGPPTVIMTYATEQPPQVGRLVKMPFFTASATWDKDIKTKQALIIALAPGGGGGGGTDEGGGFTDGGGGGGGGACSISLLDVSLVSGYAITIGSGGTAGLAGATGGVGGDTTVGGTIVVAKGGLGGIGPNGTGGVGGPGPSGTGQIKITGGAGQGGYGSVPGRAGDGGSAAFFGGAVRRNIAATLAAGNFGCGGGGGGPGNLPGQVGAPGAVWILEFT